MGSFVPAIAERASSVRTLVVMVRWFAAAQLIMCSLVATFIGGLFAIWVLAASFLSAALYSLDWYFAMREQGRVPKWTFHVIDVLWGWPGGALAQMAFRREPDGPFVARFLISVFLSLAGPVGWIFFHQP